MWKVVIIDDDRRVLQRMRNSIDWKMLGAVCAGEGMDGRQGLEIIASVKPDIVITDVYMPVMNGLEMLEQLRERPYHCKTVILSGYSDFEYARQALRLNVNDYLSKPVTLQTITGVLATLIDELKSERQERSEQEELRDKLMRYEPFVQQQELISMLTGTSAPSNLQPASVRENAHYVVLGLEIMRDERLSGTSAGDWNLYRFAVGNIVKEILAEQWSDSDYVELFSNHAAVLLRIKPTENKPADEAIRALGRRMLHCAETYIRIRLHIGIGRLQKRWQDIPCSTEQAFHALSVRAFPVCAHGSLFACNMDSESGSGAMPETAGAVSSMRPIRLYQQLGEAIRNSREKQALAIIRDFLDQLQTNRVKDALFLQRLGIEITTIIAYSSDNRSGSNSFRSLPSPHLEAQRIATVEQLGELLKATIRAAFADRQWQDNVKHRQAVEFMIEFVHNHYNENISLSELAGKVYISRNYLSEIFRQSTGESFNHYLTRVRMEKARGLLMEGKYLIYEISELVGYKNVPYFSTLFKKYNGFNPSDFIKT